MTTPLSQLEDQKIQPFSIRALRIDAVKQRCTPYEISKLPKDPLPFLIQKIIDIFHAQEAEKREDRPRFGEVVHLTNLNHNFSLRIFLRSVNLTSKLGQSILKLNKNAPVQTCQTDYVGFLYRPGNLFSFTTDDAWRVTLPYTDYRFPKQIAMRFFSETITAISFHELSGNVRKEQVYFNTAEQLDHSEYFFRYVTEGHAHLRPECSLLALKAFADAQNPAAQVNIGSIRFNTDLSLAHFPELFEHLAKVKDQKPTQNTAGKPEVDTETWKFWDQFADVPQAIKKQLNRALERALFDAFQLGKSGTLHLSHKLVSDFQKGTLSLNSTRLATPLALTSVTPIAKLFDRLRPHVRNDSQEHFIADLKTFSIAFKTNKTVEQTTLIKMIGGEIHLPDTGQTFVRLNGMWLSLSGDYLYAVEQRFRSVIDRHFTHDAQITLPLPWPSKQEVEQDQQNKEGLYAEEIYNSRYKKKKGFIHGDRVLIEKIELFDLMRVVKTGLSITYYLYHVKAGTGQTVRDVSSQICVSAALIYDAISNQKTDRLEALYVAQRKHNEQAVDETIGTLEKFKATFTKENIVYVCALYDDSASNRSLGDECKLVEILQPTHFSDFDNPQTIIDVLKQERYLSTEGRVTPQLKSHTQEQFVTTIADAFPKSKEVRQHLRKIAVSSFDSLIAKMELSSLPKRIKFDLKICEIPKPENPQPNPPQHIPAPALARPPLYIEQSKFRYQNTTYLIQPTCADHASALHALSDEEVKGYAFLLKGRQDFVEAIRANEDEAKEPLNTLIKALTLNNSKLFDDKTKGQAKQQRTAYQEADTKETAHWKMLENKFIAAYKKMSEKWRTELKLKLQFNNQPPTRANLLPALHQHYQAVYPLIRDKIPKSYVQQVIKYNDLIVDDQAKKEAAEAVMASDAFREAYLACLQDEAYVIQQEELELYAQLKEYRLLILSEDDHNQIVEAVPCQDPTHVLFRRGAHYSRCRKVED
ncbi:MAG: hypothetical protein KDK65_02980 [Chlamydiia bacterium]|nr:hypothetical protein [Chlamydiia bacterium]